MLTALGRSRDRWKLREQHASCVQWQHAYDRVCKRQGDAPVPAYPQDAVTEAIGGLLLETPIAGLRSPWDTFLQDEPEARVFFINELFPRFSEVWEMLAPGVRGWQSLHYSVRRTISTFAYSFVSGISLCAPSADDSSPLRRSVRLAALPS